MLLHLHILILINVVTCSVLYTLTLLSEIIQSIIVWVYHEDHMVYQHNLHGRLTQWYCMISDKRVRVCKTEHVTTLIRLGCVDVATLRRIRVCRTEQATTLRKIYLFQCSSLVSFNIHDRLTTVDSWPSVNVCVEQDINSYSVH